MSGSVIERIRLSGFTHPRGHPGRGGVDARRRLGLASGRLAHSGMGLHDVGAAGLVHDAGFFTLGVLINLGPRIGRFNTDGTANDLPGHNMPMSLIGLMLIVMGFFGFLGGCIIYTGETWTTIYNTPTTLSAFAFNTLLGVAGGMDRLLPRHPRSLLDDVRRAGRRLISVGRGSRPLLPGLRVPDQLRRRPGDPLDQQSC